MAAERNAILAGNIFLRFIKIYSTTIFKLASRFEQFEQFIAAITGFWLSIDCTFINKCRVFDCYTIVIL